MIQTLKSKFPQKISFLLFALLSISYVLSLFLLQLFGAVLFLMWIFDNWGEKKKSVDIIIKTIFLFGVIRLISLIFSSYPATSNEALYKEAFFYAAVLAFFFYIKTFEKKKVLDLILIFILGAVAMSVVGITKFVLGNVERAEGISSGYAVFSSYLLVALALALFYPRKFQNVRLNLYWPVIILTLFIGITTSLGRTNIFISILLFITAIIFKKINFKQILFLVLLFIVSATIYFYLPAKQLEHKFENRLENITQLSDRDVIWKGAKQILLEKPTIGFGPRTFKDIFPLRDQFADKNIGGWHNDFLQIYFESGLLGLIAFLILLGVPIIIAYKQINNQNIYSELRGLSLSLLLAIISLILSALTAGFITSVVLSIVFVFLLSVLSRIEADAAKNN
jgi:O-antigen ligase